jgi:hypothetical protein
MRAFGAVLEGVHPLGDIGVDTGQLTSEDRTILEITLALHDIGKREDSDGSHAEIGYRLLNRHHVALRDAIRCHCEASGIVPVVDEDDHLRMILWLVRHHEVLREVYWGDRRAVHLDRISAQWCKNCFDCAKGRRCRKCREKVSGAFWLLLVVSVCDTMDDVPEDVMQRMVEFWRELIESNNRAQFHDLSNRVTRWTCHETAGRTEGSASQQTDALWNQLNGTARDVFSYRIGRIVDGRELLQALSLPWKARLLNLIADHYAHNFNTEEVTLSFARRYDPGDPESAELLAHYDTAIRNRTITTSANYAQKEIRVACPSGKQ